VCLLSIAAQAKTKSEDERQLKDMSLPQSGLAGRSGAWTRGVLGPSMLAVIGRLHLQDPLPSLHAEPWGMKAKPKTFSQGLESVIICNKSLCLS
jgi:hypothetical protein